MPGFNHMLQAVCTIARNRELLIGSWDCNGASSPTSLLGDLKKLGTVVRTSAGLFTYSFNIQQPGKILEAQVDLRGAQTVGDFVHVNAINEAAGTITVNTKDAAGVTDIPAVEAMRVVLLVWVSRMKNLLND
jgi:hypothetical protein